ncbi:MAG: hypothetical protein MR966_10995, partial [Lachnospiraceae bacterium]|nr:hypothetical protein [Lachnospiraceae bacterium]
QPFKGHFLPLVFLIVKDGFMRLDICINLLDCYNHPITMTKPAHNNVSNILTETGQQKSVSPSLA